MSQLPQEHTSAKVETAKKKAYTKPKLEEYGSLSKLTRKTGPLGDTGAHKPTGM
jgi:hypothetical protein